MSPLWGVFLLIVLGVIWLVGQGKRAALRDSYRALPPQTVREIALLATLYLLAAWRSLALLITPGQQTALPLVAHGLVAALVLLVAAHRFRRP